MKKLFTLFALLLCLTNLKAQFVTIPDANFVTWLQTNVPSAMSGNQMDTTDVAVTNRIDINISGSAIFELTGIRYFDSLKVLDCSDFSGNGILYDLSELPNSLDTLRCQGNILSSLPTLPNSIKWIECAYNNIVTIPDLPSNLYYLDCSYNNLSHLPASLPQTLTIFGCGFNQLSTLPTLPNYLKIFHCNNNQLTNFPNLPDSLREFNCDSNSIFCFPTFPNNNYSLFSINYNQFSCLPNYVQGMSANDLNYPLCISGYTANCSNTRGICGFVFNDANNNCIKNALEPDLSNLAAKLYDNIGNLIQQTSSSYYGKYSFIEGFGTYNLVIDTANKPYQLICQYPGNDSLVTLTYLQQIADSIDFAITCKPGFDVGVQSISTNGITFPGLNHVLNVNAGDMTHWYNLNCASGTSGTLSFSVSGPITYVSPLGSALTPSVTGNIYTYTITDFGTINNSTDFQLIFQTDTTAQAGDIICINATVTPTSGDNNISNNTFAYCYDVFNSYDPNIKETYPKNVQPGFNDWLTYTIHFQNTGNAPAFNIRLADTLDTMLDLETFQVINYSHQNLVDLTGNVLNVRFPNIQLPDSTTNSAGSKGFIQYRVKPKATWVAPYQIKNTAYIYFDYNAPIVTNTTLNTILIPTGLKNQTETVMNLYPNPSNGSFTIELNSKEKQSIHVFDITGNEVLSQSIENGKAIIDGSHLASGIYNINIKGSDSVVNKKLVIVK